MTLPDPVDRPLLTVDEVVDARLLPLSRSSVYEAVAAGHLPSVHVGRRVFIPNHALRAALGLEPAAPLVRTVVPGGAASADDIDLKAVVATPVDAVRASEEAAAALPGRLSPLVTCRCPRPSVCHDD